MTIEHQILSGVKVLMETVSHSRAVSMGFFFGTGSAWESPGHKGWSHLLEHMVFKGTENRTQKEISLAIDRVGGDLNAYTDKEEISFYCTLPAEHWELGLELLADITQKPLFPKEELVKEKSVIHKEILSIKDDPEDWLFDWFLEKLWPDHPYGCPVAGRMSDVRKADRDSLEAFFRTALCKAPLTISMAGNFPPEEVLKALERLIVPAQRFSSALSKPPLPVPRRWIRKTPYQMDQMLWVACSPLVPDFREVLLLQLFSLSFGETMGSRLFQNIREKKGLCYSITSLLGDFRQLTTLFISASTSRRSASRLISSVEGEWTKALQEGMDQDTLTSAVTSLKGSQILQLENTEYRMNRAFQHHVRFGRNYSWEETQEILDSLSPDSMNDLLDRTFRNSSLNFLHGAGEK